MGWNLAMKTSPQAIISFHFFEEKYQRKLRKILVRPKKGPHFSLVEESGKILNILKKYSTQIQKKTWKNTPQNPGGKITFSNYDSPIKMTYFTGQRAVKPVTVKIWRSHSCSMSEMRWRLACLQGIISIFSLGQHR